MELTRRDVLVALSASGLGSAAGCSGPQGGGGGEETDDGGQISEREVETLVAVAEVVYPSDVENVDGFVREYSARRVRADEEYGRGVAEAVRTLDDYVGNWHDEPYRSLSAEDRAETLDGMAVDTADPNPEGTPRERVRYFVVNELLYAFYATPTGAGLAGLENPPGYPGGTRSYHQPPGR